MEGTDEKVFTGETGTRGSGSVCSGIDTSIDTPIIKFVTDILHFYPHPYQIEFLNDCVIYDRLASLWCRQSGKSTSVAAYCLYETLTTSNFNVMIIAPTQEQSSELFLKVRYFIESTPLINYTESITQTEIIFNNKSRIKALPCGPEGVSIRGYTANIVVIEEAGYIKDSIVNSVILPMISATKGKVIKIGTPKGKNHFYESCFGRNTEYKVKYIDWKKTVECGQHSQKFINEMMNSVSSLEFQTEWEARFIEDTDCYFPQSLIESCVDSIEIVEKQGHMCEYVLGVDFARMGEDSSVFVIVERQKNGHIRCVNIIETKHKLLTDAIARIKYLDGLFNFKKIYLDQTGLGAGPTDVLKSELGSWKIEGVTFSVSSKVDMYSNLKMLMERKKIKIPEHRKLFWQLSDLRYEITKDGRNLKIHHSERGHDDYPDALALACLYFKENMNYTPMLA